MGILNKKQRIIDAFITEEGKRQLTTGEFKIESYSFSDVSAVYRKLLSSGNIDPTANIVSFEANNLPQDSITFESNDSGFLFTRQSSDVHLANGQILTRISSSNNYQIVTGSQFSSMVTTLLESTIDNFKDLKILATPSPLDENFDEFIPSQNVVQFSITNNKPIPPTGISRISITQAESLFQDKRLSQIPNFKFLPPINKKEFGGSALANYSPLGSNPLKVTDLLSELDTVKMNGFKKEIRFLETSKENNLFCQFFEVSKNSIKKLDVIDFGIYPNPTNKNDVIHIFFIGKVLPDSNDNYTFIHLFTIVFE